MSLTNSQIDSVLSISSTASLISGAAVITDNSNFASIGVGGSDTVKILLWIQDSTGSTFYKNSGYDAANYASPDLQPLTTPKTYSFTLPTVTSGAYLQGQYTVNYKVQVVSGGNTNETYKALYMNVCGICNGITADVRGEVSYQTAVVSITDYTNYKSWTALANTLYLYPPTNTGAAQHATFHGSPATLTYVPVSGFPYTGTWQWTLSSNITYTDALTQTSTTCQETAQGSFEVVQSQLCKVRCLLDKYRTEFYAKIAVKTDPLFERNWNLAADDYMMAFMSERCGMPQTTINKYIDNIYKITGIDPNCDCGCDDGTSQPLVPTSIINGADGTDGSQILYGSGVPSGGTGVVGDTYINTANNFVYTKTGATTWTYKLTLAGTAGVNGASVLTDQYPALATLGTGWESLAVGRVPYTMAAGQLATNGDELYIRGVFTLPAAATFGQTVRIILDPAGTAIPLYADKDIQKFAPSSTERRGELFVRLTRTSDIQIKYTMEWKAFSIFKLGGVGHGYDQTRNVYSTGVITSAISSLTSNIHYIDCQANSNYVGDIVCEAFEIVYYKQAS